MPLPLRVPLLEQAEISVVPTLTYTSTELRGYTPSQRQCFFNSERRLFFFKFYAQHNCEAECLSNYTKIKCGCVKFSSPRMVKFSRLELKHSLWNYFKIKIHSPGASDTKICGAGSLKCYQTAEKELFGEDIIDGLKVLEAKSFRMECNCLPACTTILYDAVANVFSTVLYSIVFSFELCLCFF